MPASSIAGEEASTTTSWRPRWKSTGANLTHCRIWRVEASGWPWVPLKLSAAYALSKPCFPALDNRPAVRCPTIIQRPAAFLCVLSGSTDHRQRHRAVVKPPIQAVRIATRFGRRAACGWNVRFARGKRHRFESCIAHFPSTNSYISAGARTGGTWPRSSARS